MYNFYEHKIFSQAFIEHSLQIQLVLKSHCHRVSKSRINGACLWDFYNVIAAML